MRLACVQNGNYTLAAKNFAGGGEETYNGQFYTVREFQKFAADAPHIVISLDAPAHEEVHQAAVWAGIPEERPFVKLPRRFLSAQHARRVIRRLERFDPSHLLLRCGDVVACELLEWANSRGIRAAAIIAARFARSHPACVRFCRLANNANVEFVANHNRVATETMLDCGLEAHKAIAWDLPPAVTPDQFSPRRRTMSDPVRLLFAGSVERAKGVEDFVEGASLCRAAGSGVEATVCGDGPLRTKLQAHQGVTEGWLQVLGRVSQHEVVRRMAASDFLVVPSRKDFAEGLPFVIQEGLAVRTPLLLSDHPVFVKYFHDGEGVRFFPERNSRALADLILQLSDDTAEYARLSEQTAAAWQSLHCPTKYHDLLEKLTGVWGRAIPSARNASRLLSLAKS